jgi:hypothetical protein
MKGLPSPPTPWSQLFGSLQRLSPRPTDPTPTSYTATMEDRATLRYSSPSPPSIPYTHTIPSSPPPDLSPSKSAPHAPAATALKRLQFDLLLLTSFSDNSTLHWRPSWFSQAPFSLSPWTLHNPPNVVTERLPQAAAHSRHVYTRRMRRAGDPAPAYIKTWEHWRRVCALYGVPEDFLCEEQVGLMREGLLRDEDGALRGRLPAMHFFYIT